MKKLNARRFVALALALVMVVPMIGIPALAADITNRTTTTNSTPNQVVGTLEALFSQDFEAFDTLKGPVTPSSGVFKGPSSAKIVPASDGHGNVLQIDCKAMNDNGEYWVCFDNNKNIWVKINNIISKKLYFHPDSEDGKGANLKNVDIYGLDTKNPQIYTDYTLFIMDGTIKTPGGATYRVRGYVNNEKCQIECKLYSFDQKAYDYESEYEYLYESEYLYKYEYIYEYEYECLRDADGEPILDKNGNKTFILDKDGNKIIVYEYEYEKDENGNFKLDEDGNKILVLDEDGYPIHALDENGEKIPCYEKDFQGRPVVKTDSQGNMMVAKDEEGNNLVYRYEYIYEYAYEYVYEYAYEVDEEGDFVLDAEGNKILVYEYEYEVDEEGNFVLDDDGNKIIATDADGNKIFKLDADGNKIPAFALDAEGNKIIAKDEEGNEIFKLDAEGNKIPVYEEDAEGNLVHAILRDKDGNKVVAVDEEGNPLYVLDENGQKVYSLKGEAERVPVLDVYGNKIPLRYPDGSTVPALDAENNKIPVKDAMGNFVYATDENGNKIPKYDDFGVKVPALDEEGNIVYKTDSSGQLIEMKDVRGGPVYQEIPIDKINYHGVKLVIKKDANGQPIGKPVMQQATNPDGSLKFDEEGNPVMEPVMVPDLNSDGTQKMVPVMIPAVDPEGNIIYVKGDQMKDENGELVFDENGEPVYEKVPKMVEKTTPVLDAYGNPRYTERTVYVYVQERDADGKLKYDDNGEPVYKQALNKDGSLKFDSKGDPVYEREKEVRKSFVKDDEGNTVWQYVYDGNGDAEAAAPRWEIQYEEDGVTPKTDKYGNILEYWVYPQVGKPVQVQKTDADGNLLYDDFGNPIMEYQMTELRYKVYSKLGVETLVDLRITEKVYLTETVKEPAPDVQKMEYEMEEVLTKTVSSAFVANSSVRDAYGGYKNVAQPAYIQTAEITASTLIFSTDYYFSKDLTKGMDIRINVYDEKGNSKVFDFANLGNPSNGTIEIKPHNDAPTTVVSGSVKVPLETWCNIIIIADFTSGSSALYVNGALVSVRQNVNIKQQDIKKEVIINSQTTKYQTTGSYVPMVDENGETVMTVQLDLNGNPISREKLDADGNYVYDENGNHEYEYMMVPVMVPEIAVDEEGNPIPVLTDKKDADGNIVYEVVYDEEGNPTMIEQVDSNGNVIMVEKLDENGNFVRDENGEIVMTPSMVPLKAPVQVPATTDKYENVLDENGVLKTEIQKDADGNPIMVNRVGLDGTTESYPAMIPVQKLVTEVKLDKDGNPVTETVKEMAPDSGEWITSAVKMKGASWNLGHFLRGGNVKDYQGYMLIDNLAIYDGKDLDKVFASKGYKLDFNETYEGMSVGDVVKMDGKTTDAHVEEVEGDKALRVDYADTGVNDANYRPGNVGFTYMQTEEIVLEANYFMAEGSSGQIQSQFYQAGAHLDIEGAPFEYSRINGTSRVYSWVDLYWIRTESGASEATVRFSGSTDTYSVSLGKWHAFSTVLNLKTGKYTLYIDGVAAISGQLMTRQKDVDGVTREFNLCRLSVGKDMWTVSKVNKPETGLPKQGHFYVDDVTITELGKGRAGMKTVEGLLSADIYSNGNYVKTVTDYNYFYLSEQIELRNVELFDLGSDQLLKTDDATIRFTSPSGIRFASKVDVEALEALYDRINRPVRPGEAAAPTSDEGGVGLKAVRFGTLIVPTDLLDGRDLTFEVLEANNIPYVDVRGTKGYYYDLDGDGVASHIAGSIYDLKEENIDRLFSAVTYVRIVLENGIVYNVYANRVAKASAQSLADDTYGEYNAAQQAVIDAFYAGQKPAADIPVVTLPDENEGSETN